MHVSRRLARLAVLPVVTATAVGLLAPAGAGAAPKQGNVTLRLGYFPNVTHASAIVGVEGGIFQQKLGNNVKLETSTFNAGPQAVEALNSGALDATYIGPNPAINAYAQSGGEAIRIISGATSGGAFLVVKPSIKSAKDLKGKQVASPQLGNTQDVALRTWLTKQGLKNSVDGGGDVTIAPTANADVPNLFDSGQLDGAWVPEPTASLLVLEHKGHVLVDEKDLWPQGQFVTTQLIVRTEFLQKYPDAVAALLRGHVKAVQFAQSDPDGAKKAVNAALDAAGGKSLKDPVLERAWGELTVTYDPIASALEQSAKNAVAAGTTPKQVDLKGIYDLRPLNAILKKQNVEPVSAGGLGEE